MSVTVNLQLVLNLPGIKSCSERGKEGPAPGAMWKLQQRFSEEKQGVNRSLTQEGDELTVRERVWGRSCHVKNLCQ